MTIKELLEQKATLFAETSARIEKDKETLKQLKKDISKLEKALEAEDKLIQSLNASTTR